MIYNKKEIDVRAAGHGFEIDGDMHAMLLDGETITLEQPFFIEGCKVAQLELVVRFRAPRPVKATRTRKVVVKRRKK